MTETECTREKRLLVLMTFMISTLFALLFAGCSAGAPANLGISDAEITSAVEANLAADSRTQPYDIVVSTTDGKVKLTGGVATVDERTAASEVAGASRGVVAVDSYVHYGSVEAR